MTTTLQDVLRLLDETKKYPVTSLEKTTPERLNAFLNVYIAMGIWFTENREELERLLKEGVLK